MRSRDVSVVAGILGVLKAGGAYLPLDEGFPVARLAFMVGDSGVSVVVCGPGVRELAGALVPSGWRWSPGRSGPGSEGSSPAGSGAGVRGRPANAAYVIYTSGSTGTPKGVVVEHRRHCALRGRT